MSFHRIVLICSCLLLGACGDDSFNRDSFVNDLMTASQNRMTEAQANCVYDKINEDEAMKTSITADNISLNSLPADLDAKLTVITADCITATTGPQPSPTT